MTATGFVTTPDQQYRFGRFKYETDLANPNGQPVDVRVAFVKKIQGKYTTYSAVVLTAANEGLEGDFTFAPFVACSKAIQTLNYLKIIFAKPITIPNNHLKID